MPHFLFSCPPGTEVQGCIERVCLYTPWSQAVPAIDENGQPVVDPQTGQRVILNPLQAAWNWMVSQGLYWPPGVQLKVLCTNPNGKGEKPTIYCYQKSEAVVDRAQINAPYASPMGNGRQLTMPPTQTPKNQCGLSHGQYEEIDNSGMAITVDPLMGEVDGQGGTFTDLDASGREEVRQMARAPGANMVGR